MIGVVTAIVAEFATILGCVIKIDAGITAITLVALGTSLPDTFASMAAAQQEKYADSAVGNVTGSNSVNVFLGLGLPWLIAVFWEKSMPYNTEMSQADIDLGLQRLYYVPAGALGWSVLVFIACALTCIMFLMIRRYAVGGELGGGAIGRTLSCIFLIFLWFVYIVMSILQNPSVGAIDVTPTPDGPNGTQHWASLFIYKPPWYVCREKSAEEPQGMFCFKDRCRCKPKPGEEAAYDCMT